MLFKRTWLFLLILLIAIISQNVESNREDLDTQSRRNFFKDIENFFSRLFRPNRKPYKQNTPKAKTTKNFQKITIKIHGKNLRPAMDSNVISLRNNQSIHFPTNETDYERSNKSVMIGDVDVDIILKDSSHKARENQEIKSRKINFIGDDDYEMTEKYQRRKQKHLMIIVTNNKEVHEDMLDSESLYLDPDKDLTEGDFEKDSLRRKYGKACIKVAVRKCYKTIHSVRNIVCKTRYSCKSSFKSTFLFEAKRSCIIEFDPTTNLIKKQRKLETNNRVRKSKRDTALYITQCMPQLVKEYIRTVPSRLKKPSGTKSILRGRSTRKCHKLLRGKCYNACMYSLRQTCSNVDCSKHFQKIFKKECKRECARQYLIIRDSSDSSVSKISDDSD